LATGQKVSPQALSAVFAHMQKTLATRLTKEFSNLLLDLQLNKRPYDPDDYSGVGELSLKALALRYLTDTGQESELKFARLFIVNSNSFDISNKLKEITGNSD